ncbi:MAG: hypothetical protein HY959_09730 [Ignavibacteriae bacterium]|nr:hypothetical protein [Ignavibacteriota bacterium]
MWLPFFHYISAGAILIGAGMQAIRFANIIIWFLTPVLLFRFLYNYVQNDRIFISFLSAILCALFPIGILMGTTAQPEPIFSILILLFIITSSKEKYLISSFILSAACLMRYEAWAVLAVVFILYLSESIKRKRIISGGRILNIILPALFITAWALLRLPFDGMPFGFLFQTQQFASDALKESNSFQGGFFKIIKDLFHYPVIIPALFTGLNIIFIPFGIKNLYRNNKLFLFSGAGILAFITFSWMMKSNLGLNRHFVSLIPVYSVLAAYGILNVIKYFEERNILSNLNIRKSLPAVILLLCAGYLVMWLYIWQTDNKDGYPERKSAIEFFKTIEDGKTIFCNDAVFEILSGLEMERFNHVWMENNPAAYTTIKRAADKEGFIYIITSEDKIHNVKSLGKIIYTSPINNKTGMTVLIMKVESKTQ